MRQYEQEDCYEEVKTGQKLEISSACISIPFYGEVNYVSIFGNPETKKIVFVPFGSRIIIERQEYKIIQGEKYAGKRYCKSKQYTFPNPNKIESRIHVGEYDHSSKCLLDKDKNLHNLEDFIGKEAEIISTNTFIIPFFSKSSWHSILKLKLL